MSHPDNTGGKQTGGRFQPGQSGNPNGKPKGARHRATRMVEALIEGEAEEIVRKAVELAKAGDGPVLRAVLDRIAPSRKDAPISFELPPIDTAADAKAASSAVIAAVAAGDVTPSEGSAVMALLVSHKMIVEATDFEARLSALEGKK